MPLKWTYSINIIVREKKIEDKNKKEKKNNTPLILSEKMINTAIEEVIKRNEKDKKYNIRNTTIKQRNKLFLELLEKDNNYIWILYIIE